MLAEKWRLGTDEDALVLRLNVQANFPEQRRAQAGPLSGHIAMRSLPDGSTSGLLQKRATPNPFTQASCYSWSNNGHTSTTVWKKTRSVPHFLQPPAICKEPESNAKMYVNQRRDEMAQTWKHILRHNHFCANYQYKIKRTPLWLQLKVSRPRPIFRQIHLGLGRETFSCNHKGVHLILWKALQSGRALFRLEDYYIANYQYVGVFSNAVFNHFPLEDFSQTNGNRLVGAPRAHFRQKLKIDK